MYLNMDDRFCSIGARDIISVFGIILAGVILLIVHLIIEFQKEEKDDDI